MLWNIAVAVAEPTSWASLKEVNPGGGVLCAPLIFAALVAASQGEGLVPAVTGLGGVGKHTVAQAVAERLGLAATELPVRRLLIPRVMQTHHEVLMSSLLAAAANLGAMDLLVLSSAEWLAGLTPEFQRMVMKELGRVPNVLLLADAPSVRLSGVVPVACPGLEGQAMVRGLVAAAMPGLTLSDAATDMICRAASGPPANVLLPGRVLYLVRLGLSLSGVKAPGSALVTPDVITPALTLAQPRWRDDDARSEDE